ncbi:hypothetical protein [Actinomadura sp. GTD37]|uniref:hypothetical protein n=1 Tax=Actinomadura sp. GTD37 TaxID=1778030 RepID=UPI0035BF1149
MAGPIGLDAMPGEVGHWKPARTFPDHYPGDCPDHDYVLLNDRVHPLRHEGGAAFSIPGHGTELDALLTARGLPRLEERVAVLAYGANRNPATLRIKHDNYGYRSPNGVDLCVPVLRATLADADVAGCGIHGQGYLYGELLLRTEYCRGTTLEARVCMVDPDQLRVLNDSEGIRRGDYRLARIPGVRLAALDEPITAVGYVAGARTWVSPVLGAPLGFASVPASGRRYPSMTATQSLDHVLGTLGLRADVARITGLDDDDGLAADLAKYLNGQWWYSLNTGRRAIPGYDRVLALLRGRMSESQLPVRTLDHLAELGDVLDAEAAYAPGRSLNWATVPPGPA